MNDDLEPSIAGTAVTKSFEKCSLAAYWDVDGWSIGWGYHGPEVTKDMRISQVLADSLFLKMQDQAAATVRSLVKVRLNQGQFDGLVDFVYEFGEPKFAGSTLLKLVNAGNFAAAAAEFLRWDHEKEGGVLVENSGLMKRRIADKRLFLS